MSSIAAASVMERRDIPLEEAFQVITEGKFSAPNPLQQAVFPRLLTQDTGMLVPTGPGAGRLEAVFIPSVVSMRPEKLAHRLFIVGPDDCPLDDYMFRLPQYLRALVVADGEPRTIWFEEPERAPIARKYMPDGSFINGASDHPFSDDVDVVVMPLSHFRMHFFATGGVHGVPEVLGFDKQIAQEMAPRGLFYFDESFGSTRDQQLEFMRMVEFLFAQDLDVIVGSSSLPESACEEMLPFLEPLAITEAQSEPARTIRFTEANDASLLSMIEQEVRRQVAPGVRIVVTVNDPRDAALGELYSRLSEGAAPSVFFYNSAASRAQRGRVYGQVRDRERSGEGYVLVADGPAVEVSDLDATVLITAPCSALSLVRRANRCNRRGKTAGALLHVIGSGGAVSDMAQSEGRRDAFVAALRGVMGAPQRYDPDLWKRLAF